jgi:carbonic anhydrase
MANIVSWGGSMSKKRVWALGIAVTVVLLVLWGWLTESGRRTQFIIGGAMVNVGYLLQDPLESYDFKAEHEHSISPDEVWVEMQQQNALAAKVREWLPRTVRHPLVALVVCMDARIDTNELTGDTRRFYYIIRTAGSVLSEREEEMLELAVENGVELVVFTTHSDCAAEKAAAAPDMRQRFPALAQAVDEREDRIREFLARPVIAEKITDGKLAVKLVNIDTMTERMLLQ